MADGRATPYRVRYSTIVADPPWSYPAGFGANKGRPGPGQRSAGGDTSATYFKRPLPYPAMSVSQIAALPVDEMAAPDAHLYLWTTQRYLWDAPTVARAWGFEPSCTLTWCKPKNGVHGGTFVANVEFVLFCRRGRLSAKQRVYSQWFEWDRGRHSQKPEAFLDMVEETSPGPYLELFARRNRLGWDTWGNESLEHLEVPA